MTPLGALRDRVTPQLRPFLRPSLFVVAYVVLDAFFFEATQSYGMLSPSGSVHLAIVAWGAGMIVLKLVVVFVIPGVIAYRLAARIVDSVVRHCG
jgi:hypothetical protein